MTDREIDAKVVAHIMGKKVGFAPKAWEGSDWLSSDTPTAHNVIAIINEEFKPGDWNPPAWIIPYYSEDIDSAWQVVEHFKKPLWTFTLYLSHDTYTADFAEWEDESAIGDKRKGTARDTCASRAICLAALRALGVTP